MSTFRRLLGTAQKALDQKNAGSGRPGQGSDWRSMVRSAADSITGESASATRTTRSDPTPRSRGTATAPNLSETDRRAIARYDYLVRTAEPEQLEQVHREAFERLTPEQRVHLSTTLRSELPPGEQPRTDAPQDLARSATRLGAMDPRRLTRLLGRSGGGRKGPGLGAVGAAGGLLAVVAGGAVATGVGASLLQDALGAGIDVDALTGDLEGELGGMVDGFEGVEGFADLEGVPGVDALSDGVGGSVSDAGDQVSGFGDRLSDLNLGDLWGR